MKLGTYHQLAEELIETANDLLSELGSHDTRTARTQCRLAYGHLQRAAELVLELEPSPELAAEVMALQALCLCGHDRGDHLVESPHVCEGRVSRPDLEPFHDLECPCSGYVPMARATLPDLMTEPAPPPTEVA